MAKTRRNINVEEKEREAEASAHKKRREQRQKLQSIRYNDVTDLYDDEEADDFENFEKTRRRSGK